MKLLPTPRSDSLLGQWHSSTHLRWQAVVHLSWLAILMLENQRFAWSWFMPTLITIPLYLFCYARIYFGPSRHMTAYIAAITLLGLLLWPWNRFAFGYLMVAGMALGLTSSWRLWLGGTAVLATLSWLMTVWLRQSTVAPVVVVCTSLFGGFSYFLYIRNLHRDAELRLSQEEVRRLATLAERERIGRDLHDLLGHTLSLVTLKSELAHKLALADPPRAKREMQEVERVSRHALAEVRAAVTGMRRTDLAAELISARLMLEATGIAFDAASPETSALPVEIEAPLALVLREAITNIHRHARATTAGVRLLVTTEGVEMQISDNGCGGLAAHGNGVSGMRERVRALGGTLAIESPHGHGTRLHIEVPLPAHVIRHESGNATPAVSNASGSASGWLPQERHAT